jgi:hypothetical protein
MGHHDQLLPHTRSSPRAGQPAPTPPRREEAGKKEGRERRRPGETSTPILPSPPLSPSFHPLPRPQSTWLPLSPPLPPWTLTFPPRPPLPSPPRPRSSSRRTRSSLPSALLRVRTACWLVLLLLSSHMRVQGEGGPSGSGSGSSNSSSSSGKQESYPTCLTVLTCSPSRLPTSTSSRVLLQRRQPSVRQVPLDDDPQGPLR